ncbi:hypothetical protein [Streptomyces katrae]|uniref:Uncharacterized protein n=1 Tax=Streptomyces katrae TaxID=68223 RepID=A0A0F4JF05_9ACTN|nr:hypothetical protein [Streptomyces katrae]KJY32394.1 hypothetical protein VR44_16040 [Streptomyces katrae]
MGPERGAVGHLDDDLPGRDGDPQAGEAFPVPQRAGDELAHHRQHIVDQDRCPAVFGQDSAGGLPRLRTVHLGREALDVGAPRSAAYPGEVLGQGLYARLEGGRSPPGCGLRGRNRDRPKTRGRLMPPRTLRERGATSGRNGAATDFHEFVTSH